MPVESDPSWLTIFQAGISHCFVNLGSDHPSIIEAMVKGQKEKKGQFPKYAALQIFASKWLIDL